MVSQGAPATSDCECDFGVPGMPEARGIHSGPPSELEHRTSLHLRNQAAELKGIKRYIDDWLTTKEDELAQLERLSETQTALTNSEVSVSTKFLLLYFSLWLSIDCVHMLVVYIYSLWQCNFYVLFCQITEQSIEHSQFSNLQNG